MQGGVVIAESGRVQGSELQRGKGHLQKEIFVSSCFWGEEQRLATKNSCLCEQKFCHRYIPQAINRVTWLLARVCENTILLPVGYFFCRRVWELVLL